MVCLLALTACASDDKAAAGKTDKDKAGQTEAVQDQPKPICPQVAIIHELENIRDYGTEKPDPSQLVGEARLQSLNGDCEYEDNGIDITFTIAGIAARGPRLGGDQVGFPFFVAVVDPDGKILNKDQMTADFKFSDGARIATANEPLHVFIPLPKDKDETGPNYRVLAGFQLTEQQLAEVRKREGATETPSVVQQP